MLNIVESIGAVGLRLFWTQDVRFTVQDSELSNFGQWHGVFAGTQNYPTSSMGYNYFQFISSLAWHVQ
jgi:hypothetical protein